MSQRVNTRGVWATLSKGLRWTALVLGYTLSFFGWFLLWMGVAMDGASQGRTACFDDAGFFIVPGWLLLRFAACLFPFSKRLSKPFGNPLSSGTAEPLP